MLEFLNSFYKSITGFFESVDNVMYYPILIFVLAIAGLFFPFAQGLFRSDCSARHAS